MKTPETNNGQTAFEIEQKKSLREIVSDFLNNLQHHMYFWKDYEEQIKTKTRLSWVFCIDFIDYLIKWWVFSVCPWLWKDWEANRLIIAKLRIMMNIFKKVLKFREFKLRTLIFENIGVGFNELYFFEFSWESYVEEDYICWVVNKYLNDINPNREPYSPDDMSISQINTITTILRKKDIIPHIILIDMVASAEIIKEIQFYNFPMVIRWFLITENKITSIPKNIWDNKEFCEIFDYKPWEDEMKIKFSLSNDQTELYITKTEWDKIVISRFILLKNIFTSEQLWISRYVYYIAWDSYFDKPITTKKSLREKIASILSQNTEAFAN